MASIGLRIVMLIMTTGESLAFFLLSRDMLKDAIIENGYKGKKKHRKIDKLQKKLPRKDWLLFISLRNNAVQNHGVVDFLWWQNMIGFLGALSSVLLSFVNVFLCSNIIMFISVGIPILFLILALIFGEVFDVDKMSLHTVPNWLSIAEVVIILIGCLITYLLKSK